MIFVWLKLFLWYIWLLYDDYVNSLQVESIIFMVISEKDRCNLWIRKLCTAMQHDCNDNIKWVDNLSSTACSTVNVMSLLNTYYPSIVRAHTFPSAQCKWVLESRSPSLSFGDLLSHLHHQLKLHYLITNLLS